MFDVFRRLLPGRSVLVPPVEAPSGAAPTSEHCAGVEEPLVPTPDERSSPVPCWRTALYPPEAHARRLLWWLREVNRPSRDLLAAELQSVYRSMCLELNWAVRSWNPVAREFTKLTTRRKVYRWFLHPEDGTRHRLRVYPAPTPNVEMPRLRLGNSAQADGEANTGGSDPVSRPCLARRAGLGRSR